MEIPWPSNWKSLNGVYHGEIALQTVKPRTCCFASRKYFENLVPGIAWLQVPLTGLQCNRLPFRNVHPTVTECWTRQMHSEYLFSPVNRVSQNLCLRWGVTSQISTLQTIGELWVLLIRQVKPPVLQSVVSFK